ncbi:MAG: bacteriophage holin [Nanoarchaeota archaeon]|nr:bacteriophage holin [Nanoarchaeota archaeon]
MPRSTLNTLNFGLALGITFGLGALFLGLTSWLFNYGTAWVELIGTVYIGYSTTLLGTIIGTIYAFVDGLIGGIVIAWFYNKLQGRG